MKVGVMLDDLRDKATQPRSMFPTHDPAHAAALMRAMDQVNGRYGRGTLRPLATGTTRPWSTRAGRLTQRYTLRASHNCGTKCHVPALEEGVETAETPGDGFRAGWLVAA